MAASSIAAVIGAGGKADIACDPPSIGEPPIMTQAVYKRFLIFLCDGAVGLDDLSRRDLWSCRLVWLTGSGGPDFAILRGDSPEYGRKLKPTSAYAALIAAVSGPMPMMFMTRLRL